MEELEKTLAQLKKQVDEVAAANQAAKLKRLLNAHKVEDKGLIEGRNKNDEVREGLKGLEARRQNLKDQERDISRDIY